MFNVSADPPFKCVSADGKRFEFILSDGSAVFITMGGLMGGGGISERLIKLADSMVGWMRGGAAMVNILASLFLEVFPDLLLQILPH